MYVLVIEDDRGIRDAVSTILGWYDMPCKIASTVERGMEMLADETPCVLLLDLMMPNMDGRCLLATLFSDHLYRELPVIVQTGLEVDHIDGAVAVLHKPYTADELIHEISKYCDCLHVDGPPPPHPALRN